MKKWDDKYNAVLMQRYPNECNSILSKELGYGLRTIERHARMLGLSKSPEFLKDTQKKATIEAARWYEYMKITGQKVHKNNANGKRYEKGHVYEPEIEKKRIEALRNRAWEDRKRIIHGMLPKTKWRFNIKAYKNE